MTDSAMPSHEELADALARIDEGFDMCDDDVIPAAARRQLALTPQPCETCEGSGFVPPFVGFLREDLPCLICHGRGWQYKPETVGVLRTAIVLIVQMTEENETALIYAVLDALNTEPA